VCCTGFVGLVEAVCLTDLFESMDEMKLFGTGGGRKCPRLGDTQSFLFHALYCPVCSAQLVDSKTAKFKEGQ